MRRPYLLAALTIGAACTGMSALAQDVENAANGKDRTAQEEQQPVTLYRQVMPDGRVVYSDKTIKGGKVDHTITVEPPIEGNLWTTEASNAPPPAPLAEPTPVRRVDSLPPTASRKTVEEATSEVIRAEMLLEDASARLRQASAETSGDPDSRATRQKWLARDVAEAEAALRRAILERDALRSNR